LKRLRNAEHFDLFNNIVIYAQDKGIKPQGLLPAWNAFLLSFDKEDKVYKRAARREETAMINAAHKKRKTSYMALKRLVEAATYSETPTVKAAALSLATMMENYIAAYRAPMTEASALIVNLLQDLAKEKNAAHVLLITGATEAISHLTRDNDAFITLFAERTYAEEEQKTEGSLADARVLADQKFMDLVAGINAFYRTNEMQQSKDPEVSATLSDIIMFINSFIHKHEAIYARRNAKYHPDHTPSSPDEEQPGGGGGTPGATVPQFAIAGQETLGDSQQMPGFGTQMSLRAADAQAFAAALYPDAKNGLLSLVDPDTEDEEHFPIADFLFDTDGVTPLGMLVDAPNLYTFFQKPFSGIGVAEAEVVKNGVHLATLSGVQIPATLSEG
jgi:hypothetical protein